MLSLITTNILLTYIKKITVYVMVFNFKVEYFWYLVINKMHY